MVGFFLSLSLLSVFAIKRKRQMYHFNGVTSYNTNWTANRITKSTEWLWIRWFMLYALGKMKHVFFECFEPFFASAAIIIRNYSVTPFFVFFNLAFPLLLCICLFQYCMDFSGGLFLIKQKKNENKNASAEMKRKNDWNWCIAFNLCWQPTVETEKEKCGKVVCIYYRTKKK